MRHLSVDIETFSSVPIQKSGLYKYAQSPDFDVLLIAWAMDGGPVTLIDLTRPAPTLQPFIDALLSPDVLVHAYNAAFEWYCLTTWLSRHRQVDQMELLRRCRCTMLHGLYCGFPAGLDAVGRAMGLPEDKRKLTIGKALLKLFCTPCKPTKTNGGRTRNLPEHEPEKWALFCEYCVQDVVTEMAVDRQLGAFPVPEMVQKEWETDQRINARGVAIDQGLIDGAMAVNEELKADLTEEAVQLTQLANPNSPVQLQRWLSEELGEDPTDLRKDTVSDMLTQDLPENARRVLEIRQELGKTSVTKYQAMRDAVCEDGRIRGLLQFYGANRTGRWAGRLVQPQNLPRMYLHGPMLDTARTLTRNRQTVALQLLYGSVADTLSQLLRTAFVPASGHAYVDADFSAIEARVVAWLASEEWVLQVFRTTGKIYEATAAQMFGVPMEKIKKGQPEYSLRQRGKVATLALGYGGGPDAMVRMGALRNGLTEDELPEIVQRWRQANPSIKSCWRALEEAATQAVLTGRPYTTHGLVFQHEIAGAVDALTIQLPSGRKLFYIQPHITLNRFGNRSLGYYGLNQTTKKWTEQETYGGKLTENVVQAIARDCLAVNIERLESAGYDIVFHVHDEVVIDCPPEQASLEDVVDTMSQPISWAPGLPLGADGWVGQYYTKD